MNLEDCGILKEDILNGVIEHLADQITSSELRHISSAAQETAQKRVQILIDEQINKHIEDLLSSSFQPLDIWGDKAGEPITLKDMMAASLNNWWTAPVDANGKAVSTNSYGTKTTRADFLVSKIAKEVIDKDLSKELYAMNKALRAQIQAAMTKSIQQIIGNILR